MWCQGPLIFYLISSTYLPTTTYQTTNYLRSPYFCQQALFPMISWIYTLPRLFSDVHFGFCSPARMTVIGMYVFTGEQIIKPDPGLISQWLAIIDDSESDQPVISTSALSRIRIWYLSISPIPRILAISTNCKGWVQNLQTKFKSVLRASKSSKVSKMFGFST